MVEDDYDQALLARESLEEAFSEAEVTVCVSGAEALSQDFSDYHVIILDYNLPDMTGLDILKAKSSKELPPVIVITGEEVLEVAVESLKHGADEFLIKSIDLFHLLPHIVHKTIDNYRWRKKIEETQTRELEKKVQIDTLKRIMMTLAHHLNNGIMPIIFSAEICERSDFEYEKAKSLVAICLRETFRVNFIIERFERYIEDEEFKYCDYLELKDAMFEIELPPLQE